MSLNKAESKQLDEEIKQCIAKNGPLSGYRIIKCTQAPSTTIRYKLKVMVERGELVCQEAKKGRIYRLPEPARAKEGIRTEIAPKMVSRGPTGVTERVIESEHYMIKRYSSGRPRKGKSMAAMAFEGNGVGRR